MYMQMHNYFFRNAQQIAQRTDQRAQNEMLGLNVK